MAAEYPRGRMVRFAGAVFRVIEEEIQSLEVSGWRWL
jgi:hypothetical protein